MMQVSIHTLQQELAELEGLKTTELQVRWPEVFDTEPPRKMRAGFLQRAIAYRLQEQVYGGLKPETKRHMDRLALSLRKAKAGEQPAAPPRANVAQRLSPGTRLMREWNGGLETVDVVDGGFAWRGQNYRTLSAVAVAITGTKWSGPKFFGLTDQPSQRKKGMPAPTAARLESVSA
jgi:hypothetical protein